MQSASRTASPAPKAKAAGTAAAAPPAAQPAAKLPAPAAPPHAPVGAKAELEWEPWRFQGSMCAFAAWETVLLVADVFYDTLPEKAMWAPVFVLHAALAALLFLMTVRASDVGCIPVVGRITPSLMAAQADLGTRCRGVLKTQTFGTLLSLYLGIFGGFRISTSGAPYLWCSIVALSALMHLANVTIMCFVCLIGLLRKVWSMAKPDKKPDEKEKEQ